MIIKKKTKIMIFEKGKTASKRFYYDNYELELVELFKYLGVMFYKNGNLIGFKNVLLNTVHIH